MVALAAKIGIVIAVTFGVYFVLFLDKNELIEQAPIVDEVCKEGTVRVGEGCVSLREECDIRGDQYYFNAATQECLMS